MGKPALRIVPEQQPVDITLALRADIERRDWAACHVAGDRAKPLSIGERVKRTWWK